MAQLQALLISTKRNWRLLLQVSAWIMAVGSTFVLAPPIWDSKEDLIWNRFAHFAVAGLVGLSFFPISRWSRHKDRFKVWIFTLVCLILSVITFFYYQSARAAWTVDYAGQRVIIGKTYSQDALDYKGRVMKEEGRLMSDEELILNYAGDIKSIWISEELRQRRLVFAAIYIALISLLAMSIIALVRVL